MSLKRTNMTRRAVLSLVAGMSAQALLPTLALADTESDLAAAQAKLEQAQAELNIIASEYEQLSAEQSATLDEIEAMETQISTLEVDIRKTETRLVDKQEELSQAVSEEYKDGSRGVVDLLMRSTSVDSLISNLYCYEKITQEQAKLIQSVKDMRDDYLSQQAELELQQAMLEEVSKVQQTQLEAMRGKQLEAQQIIDGLGQEVKDLIAKRDAELLAAQQEAERARKEREEAERAAAAAKEREQAAAAATASDASATTGANTTATSSDGASQASGKGSAAKVVAACQSTPSPGLGLCAGWCSNVMINAGYGFVPGNANDMYANYCHSSNRADLKPGMAVAVSTHPHTSAGRIYGHIGMYIGNGTMMDNIGYIRTISVDEWCSFYGETVTPRWGWLNNIVLE